MIDPMFDFYTDTPTGGDPDRHSATLKKYHLLLWRKQLPDGRLFDLSADKKGAYLFHKSLSRDFALSSDAITNSYRNSKHLAFVRSTLPDDEMDELFRKCSTIGSYTIFPATRINGKPTINAARGLHPLIGDRFDLTLECIRRQYSGERSPLSETMERYRYFFDLFQDFSGYLDFFHFQDIVSADGSSVKFFLPNSDFQDRPYPSNAADYLLYKGAVMEFMAARTRRMIYSVVS